MRVNQKEEMMDCVTLFVSVLICFPEVGTIKYDRKNKTIALTFILKTEHGEIDIDGALVEIQNSLANYHKLEKTGAYEYTVSRHDYDNYFVLEAKRDIDTITRSEISFLIELFRLKFVEDLLLENVDPNAIEDFSWYDENKQYVFSDRSKMNIPDEEIGRQVMGCRESGRVMVFSM